MAADNAIIIGMIAAGFAPKHRNQIIIWGVVGALVFRIIFAFFATYLFGFAYIKILGGLLLIWIVNDLRRDLFNEKKIKSPTKVSKERYFAQQIKNHQWIGYLGLIVILIVALQLIIGGMSDLNIIQINENFKRFF